MSSAASPSRLRGVLAGLILCVVVLAVFAAGVALLIICLVGIALLIAGLASWLHPGDVAAAWARTLGGIGLIGGSAAFASLGWLAVERLAGPLADFAGLRRRARGGPLPATPAGETSLRRARKFVAVIGILLALVCLPFAAAIHASPGAHGPWLDRGGARSAAHNPRDREPASRPRGLSASSIGR